MAISEAYLLSTPGRGRVSLSRALLTSSIPPLSCGFALGITYGNIGGVLEEGAFLHRYHSPGDGVLQGLAAIMQGGCIVGSILASHAADRFGRRRSILFSMGFVALSGLVLATPAMTSSDSLFPLFCGRALSGLGGGIACAVVPLHVSEVSPAAHRGAIEASFQLAIELGILAAYLLNFGLTGTRSGWIMSLSAALPPALAFLAWGVARLPESPRFLVANGRDDEAERVISYLRSPADDVASELDAIRREASRGESTSWSEVWQPRHRRSVLIALLILALQVGTGIDFVTVFAPRIFEQIANHTHAASPPRQQYQDDLIGGMVSSLVLGNRSGGGGGGGDSSHSELLYTVLVGVVFVAVTPFAVASVDRCGRRTLLLAGGAGMTFSLAGLAMGYAALQRPSGAESGTLPVLCIVLVLSYVAFFAFSWGPVAWVIPSELLPTNIRAKVVALGTVLNWVADYAVVGSFLSLTHAVGEPGSFALYAAINAAAFLFVLCLVPETKGRQLEENYHAAAGASGEEGRDPGAAGIASGCVQSRGAGAPG